ncbi:MAG: polymerase, sigma-24 subunit, subfamily [Parcubacteria group bacterium]|nr:polymerase, sigma-24 subunit, subfamily [Parcubacteria group bacterium]
MLADIMSFSTTEDLGALSDGEILSRSVKEHELFAVLVRRYEAPFLRRARLILKSPEDAEEVVQDAFTKMYLYVDKYSEQEGATFSSWAYTILNRVAYTKYRVKSIERGRRAELLPEVYEMLPDSRAEFLEDLSLKSEVLAALSKIPETAARLLRLQFIEGKTQEEIASSERLSVPAVKTRIHRAKKLFKDAYDKQRYE